MADTLRVLLVEPHKPPCEQFLPHELSAMQEVVGGLIQIIGNGDGTVIVCNDEAKLIGMEGNRRIEGDILAGPFFVAGEAGESLRSLTDAELEQYMQRFGEVEDISPEEVEATLGFTFISW